MKTFGQKKRVRKMKYISDQEGIMKRYFREKENWYSHLENTRQFILNSFQDGKGKIDTIAILGSGWLLDFPLEEIKDRFKKIYLIDVHHPPQIQKKTEKYKNIKLFETDLSGGGIDFCWDLRKQKEDHFKKYILDEFTPNIPELPFKPDAFISLNILNQLDILLVDFLKEKKARIIDAEILRFRKKIQKSHLNWIKEKPGCLITDFTELNQKNGEDLQEKKLIHINLPEGKRAEEWTWDFDLSKTYHPDFETRFKVKAIEW